MRMLSLAVALGALIAAPCLAQDEAPTRQARDERPQAGITAGKLDHKTSGSAVRASELIGMNIQNSQGESLGEINDLVMDANTGKIRYAAVSYGGFLGVGDKMFAVPWAAFKVHAEVDDPDDYVLVLNITQQHLEGAQGFDKDHWPDFADKKFTDDLDRRYGVEEQLTGEREDDATAPAEKPKHDNRDPN